MEKLFFSITRWLMLIGATISFVFLIGGGIYAFNLYKISQDTQVNGSTYNIKEPNISFDRFKKQHQEEIALKEKQRLKIEEYVIKTIKNGSSGHGFGLGNMPKNIIKGQDVQVVAKYVANGLKGKQPNAFGACIACHGEDETAYNEAPSLLKLPIYHGLVAKEKNGISYAPAEKQNDVQQFTTPLEQYSAKLAKYINKYAIEVGQTGVTVKEIFDFIKNKQHKYNNKLFESFKQQLEEALKSLIPYSKDLKQNHKNLEDAIKWDKFIEWFEKDFDMQIKEENLKYQNSLDKLEREKNQKISQATQAEVKLIQLLTALGTALIVFILLTMILVLFKIEVNTRNHQEVSDKD